MYGRLVLKYDGVCDLDCNQTNNICDPDCKKDEDCIFRCALEGESCADMPCCPESGATCCPGTNICSLDCRDNNICETKDMWGLDNETKWENYYTCPGDCQANVNPTGPSYTEFSDGVCDRVVDTICDLEDCGRKLGEVGDLNIYKQTYWLCDPDCSADFGVCPYSNTRDQSIADGICVQVEDGVCDPDCATDNKNCDPDCCPFNSATSCPSSPGCYCPIRVDRKDFSKSPYFTNTQDTNCHNHEPHWTENVIEICSQEAIEFLDRRGWDIKQVAESIKSPAPGGWAFDGSRYTSIITEGIQKASKTIHANEIYTKAGSSCCCKADECSIIPDYTGDECCGVGFCGDHATALLSILRTLGVPAKDVFATFTSDFSGTKKIRHAFVVYRCDPSLPYYLKLDECEGNWNKWLIIDATHHSIQPLEGSSACSHMCIWYNDYGAYPTINSTIHGFGGKISDTQGHPFPPDTGCTADECCVHEKLCPSIGINCI